MSKGDEFDRRGLIRESYRIEGITAAECRSIFLEWALSVDADMRVSLDVMLDRYGADHPEHPMTQVLREGLQAELRPRRRGGWRSRPRDG